MKSIGTILLLVGLSSCGSIKHEPYSLENANQSRATNQTYMEDSTLIFFGDYPNPFSDRSFLWFWCFRNGDVELEVYDASTDTLETIYRFGRQATPHYALAVRVDDYSHFVKCILCVDGRQKCSRQYPRWTATPDKQEPRTSYTVKRK